MYESFSVVRLGVKIVTQADWQEGRGGSSGKELDREREGERRRESERVRERGIGRERETMADSNRPHQCLHAVTRAQRPIAAACSHLCGAALLCILEDVVDELVGLRVHNHQWRRSDTELHQSGVCMCVCVIKRCLLLHSAAGCSATLYVEH